jgi:hypothetical protein
MGAPIHYATSTRSSKLHVRDHQCLSSPRPPIELNVREVLKILSFYRPRCQGTALHGSGSQDGRADMSPWWRH